MYKYYITIKTFITTIQTKIDNLEQQGKFNSIPDLLLLKEKLLNLKQDFYNEDIKDNELIEKYNQLENIYNQLI